MKPSLAALAHLHSTATPASTAVLAAVSVSPLLSTAGSVCYEEWYQLRGATAINLNLFKCSLAAALFACVVQSGPPLSAVLTPLKLRMLVLSSILGIVVGDVLWLQALKLLGSRLCILMSTLQPVLSVLAGVVFLQQPLPGPSAALSIAVAPRS